MKVKIIKCDNPNSWYADKIGQEFEVETSRFYNLVINKHNCIDKSDCEIIEPKEQDEYLTWKEGDVITAFNDEIKIDGFYKYRIVFVIKERYKITHLECIHLFKNGYRLKKDRESGYYKVFHRTVDKIAYFDGKQWLLVGTALKFNDPDFTIKEKIEI